MALRCSGQNPMLASITTDKRPIEKVPDTTAQDGTDQDVGIEDDHLSEMGSWIDDAVA
jgi:hypothetical protein